MADMSPMCSIILAIAIGAITRIAVTSNFTSWNGGKPTQLAAATLVKSKMAVPSGLVTPNAFKMSAKA